MMSWRPAVLIAGLSLPVLILVFSAPGPAMQRGSGGCRVARSAPQSLVISVRYQGTMPERVRLEAPLQDDICLRADPDGSRFHGNYPLPSPASRMAVTVVAEFRGGEQTSIPLEIVYRTAPLSFTLPRPVNGPCLPREVQRISRDLGSRDAALAAAYQARHWFYATSGCPTSLKTNVALAWFDRSYEAAYREPAFPLDVEAAEALSALPRNDSRRREANRQYVQRKLNRYALQGARKIYSFAKELGEGGFALDAIRLNDSIAVAIKGDPRTASLYRRVGINLGRLSEDRRFYINKSGIDKATVDALIRSPSAEAARVPVLAVGKPTAINELPIS